MHGTEKKERTSAFRLPEVISYCIRCITYWRVSKSIQRWVKKKQLTVLCMYAAAIPRGSFIVLTNILNKLGDKQKSNTSCCSSRIHSTSLQVSATKRFFLEVDNNIVLWITGLHKSVWETRTLQSISIVTLFGPKLFTVRTPSHQWLLYFSLSVVQVLCIRNIIYCTVCSTGTVQVPFVQYLLTCIRTVPRSHLTYAILFKITPNLANIPLQVPH